MQWRGRVRATSIAFSMAALWLCTSWITPGLLLATVNDMPPDRVEIVNATSAESPNRKPSTMPQAQDAHAAGEQHGSAAARRSGTHSEAREEALLELQTLAACLRDMAPSTPVSMEDIIAGKAPQ